ncbi:ChbG/HpnK family deacetylase [Treponema pectinovorum]|uniref:ChbG/HpnK family deacetylase n=1 Tax=Treponema pectinovorum TaxID=164 RepID=UPI00164D21A9|nr:ChbG/HpnK family deacetylase [Treponema pectinovorum]
MNSQIDFHADDYALSRNSDDDIICLCKEGKLDSISIIPNLEIFESSVLKLKEAQKSFSKIIKVSAHLNFMEGKPVSNSELVRDLVDEKGFFCVSWGRLLIWNYNPFKRKKIKEQLAREISAQIEKCIKAEVSDIDCLRIDSHQHPHMIPIFKEAIFDAIKDKNYKVEYIRNTNDPISFYKKSKSEKTNFSNVLKCLILNHYSKSFSKILKQNNLPDSYLCGVYYSGKMDQRIEKVLPVFKSNSKKNNRLFELLFHPGTMLKEELTQEFTKEGFVEFHLSENRKVEYSTCKNMKRD